MISTNSRRGRAALFGAAIGPILGGTLVKTLGYGTLMGVPA
jgi:hypothetical protein